MTVTFKHSDGTTVVVPGYFAADGDAANSSAESGTVWRAHLAPDRTGQWSYRVAFTQGQLAALDDDAAAKVRAERVGKRAKRATVVVPPSELGILAEAVVKFAGNISRVFLCFL